MRVNVPEYVLLRSSFGQPCKTLLQRAASVALRNCVWFALLLPAFGGTRHAASASVSAKFGTVVSANASAPFSSSLPADYEGGTNRAPGGSTLAVTQRYLTFDGKPWIPVMGEMHFSRVPASQWEEEILKMKAAGVTVISTYVFWIHQEEIEGQWDWSGQLDLRRFAQLCGKNGMLLWVRIGPWAHGETRNGGLPDWVLKKGPTRQLDPVFMAETKTLYGQIGEQLHGLLWKDGGPIIGIQLENEYAQRGSGKGDAYILALKKLAIASGLDVPLYSVTGWDNAVVPSRQVLPVYGGYPDAPWGDSKSELPPQEVYAFRFRSRVTGNMGMIGAGAGAPSQISQSSSLELPFLTAEMGGGIQSTYHRRPVVAPPDIAAMMPVMLGSGVNGYGSYMFQGGIDPMGKLTTLQESQATGYPTDVPIKDYDFQAPIGAFGEERTSLRLEKEWNYFLNDFGSTLAPMPAFPPQLVPKSPADESVLRWSVRTDGRQGFVFVNNYVRQHPMPTFKGVQFRVMLPGGRQAQFPQEPISIPSGAYFAWPFHLDLGGVMLRYSTAQLMAKVADKRDGAETYVFTCISGIRCELALPADAKVEAPAGFSVHRNQDITIVEDHLSSGSSFPELVVRSGNGGATLRLVVLSASAAVDTWRLALSAGPLLLQTGADVLADETEVVLRQLDDPAFHFSLYAGSQWTPQAGVALNEGSYSTFTAHLDPVTVQVAVKQDQRAGTVPPTKLGPPLPWRPTGVAEAPGDAEWSANAARWKLSLKPSRIPSSTSNLFLAVHYQGDEARLKSGSELLDDNFFDGRTWMVGLDRFSPEGNIPPLELEVLPLRADAPIYLSPAARSEIKRSGETIHLESVQALPLYQLILHLEAKNQKK